MGNSKICYQRPEWIKSVYPFPVSPVGERIEGVSSDSGGAVGIGASAARARREGGAALGESSLISASSGVEQSRKGKVVLR